MAAKVPGFSNYATEPFSLALTTTPAAIPVTTWAQADGNTAILLVSMPADGNSVALCTVGFAGATTAVPDNGLVKAKQDTAASVAFGLTSLPIRYTDADAGNVLLFASGSFSAVCQWLPITEPGD